MTNFEIEKQAVDNARRCQRNWDHSKSIPEEHIDHWIYLATHAPSKQDESFFDLYVLTDREKIDYLYRIILGIYLTTRYKRLWVEILRWMRISCSSSIEK